MLTLGFVGEFSKRNAEHECGGNLSIEFVASRKEIGKAVVQSETEQLSAASKYLPQSSIRAFDVDMDQQQLRSSLPA